MTNPTLTLTKTAQYLGVPKRTFYQWLNDKRFPVDPLPGFHPRRWAQADLDAWVASGQAVQKGNVSARV